MAALNVWQSWVGKVEKGEGGEVEWFTEADGASEIVGFVPPLLCNDLLVGVSLLTIYMGRLCCCTCSAEHREARYELCCCVCCAAVFAVLLCCSVAVLLYEDSK